MKRLSFALAFLLATVPAFAQQPPPGTVQIGQGAALPSWKAINGSCTLASSGAITCPIPAPTLPSTTTTGGTNSTFTCNQLLLRSNSGTAMADTLPSSPPSAGCAYYIQNADTSAIYGVQAGGSTQLDGTTNGFTLLGPGQATIIQSDGSNYHSVVKPTRARVATGTLVTFFLAASGCSDSNMAITSGSPWCTLQQCWNFTQANIDIGNNKSAKGVVCQLADGTYTGTNSQGGAPAAVNAAGSIAGQNTVIGFTIQGNCTTPANTIIHPVGSIVIADDYARLAVTCTTVSTTLNNSNLFVAQHYGMVVLTGTVDVSGGALTGNILSANDSGHIIQFGTLNISGGSGLSIASASGRSLIEMDGTIAFSGTPSASSMYNASDFSVIIASSAAYSGAVSFTDKYILTFGGLIDSGGACASIPGTATSVDGNSSYCH